LEKRGLWSEAREAQLRGDLEGALSSALADAEAAGAPPTEWLFDDVYAEMPGFLRRQLEGL